MADPMTTEDVVMNFIDKWFEENLDRLIEENKDALLAANKESLEKEFGALPPDEMWTKLKEKLTDPADPAPEKMWKKMRERLGVTSPEEMFKKLQDDKGNIKIKIGKQTYTLKPDNPPTLFEMVRDNTWGITKNMLPSEVAKWIDDFIAAYKDGKAIGKKVIGWLEKKCAPAPAEGDTEEATEGEEVGGGGGGPRPGEEEEIGGGGPRPGEEERTDPYGDGADRADPHGFMMTDIPEDESARPITAKELEDADEYGIYGTELNRLQKQEEKAKTAPTSELTAKELEDADEYGIYGTELNRLQQQEEKAQTAPIPEPKEDVVEDKYGDGADKADPYGFMMTDFPEGTDGGSGSVERTEIESGKDNPPSTPFPKETNKIYSSDEVRKDNEAKEKAEAKDNEITESVSEKKSPINPEKKLEEHTGEETPSSETADKPTSERENKVPESPDQKNVKAFGSFSPELIQGANKEESQIGKYAFGAFSKESIVKVNAGDNLTEKANKILNDVASKTETKTVRGELKASFEHLVNALNIGTGNVKKTVTNTWQKMFGNKDQGK